MRKVCACIVTYNPNIILLEENIAAISPQVLYVQIVDNNSINSKEIREIADKFNCEYIQNNANFGIAKALNIGAEHAKNKEMDWIVTLDQDSICPSNYISVVTRIADIDSNVGIVAPVIFDFNTGFVGHNVYAKEVRTCISSGAYTNLRAWSNVGGFDEKMFIDSVDFDFCYRLRKSGYKIIQTNQVILNHSLGESKIIKIGCFNIKLHSHSAFRYFYIAQNNIYYPKKNHLPLHLLRGNFRNLKNIFIIIMFENDKINKIGNVFSGWIKGYLI